MMTSDVWLAKPTAKDKLAQSPNALLLSQFQEDVNQKGGAIPAVRRDRGRLVKFELPSVVELEDIANRQEASRELLWRFHDFQDEQLFASEDGRPAAFSTWE